MTSGPAPERPRRHGPATRRAGLRPQLTTIARSRSFGYAIVVVPAAALLAAVAADAGRAVTLLAAPVAAAAVLIAALTLARGRRLTAFWTQYAASMNLIYVGAADPPPLTPLLRAGDRRRASAWLIGADVTGAGTVRIGDDDHDEQRHVTVALLEVPGGPAPGLSGIALHRSRLEGLPRPAGAKRVELESAAFHDRYVLWAGLGVDPIALRELFSPTLIVWLTEHPLAPHVEIEADQVLVAVPGTHADAGTMTSLLDAGRELTRRVARERGRQTLAA